jgi:hypothetical protein
MVTRNFHPTRSRVGPRLETAAELAAAEQLERSADAHDAAARTLDFAAKDARDDFQADTHMRVAEAHRAAARQDRELAHRYRDQAEHCHTE